MSELPEGWELTKLDEICSTVTSGSRDWAKYYSDTGSKFIRMTNLQRDSIYLNLDDLKFVDIQSNSADGKRTSLQFGDILMSITAELGKIGWVHDDLGEAYINQHTALIRLENKNADSKFIAYLLSSKSMSNKINRLNDSGAKAGLNLPTIRSIPLLLPPLPEQRKIAEILSTWDKAIATTEKRIANSKQQKKALMQQLLTGKKRLAGFSGDWEVVSISNLIVESRIKGTNGKTAKKITVKLYGLGVAEKEEKRSGSPSTKYYKRKSGQFIYSKLDFLNGAFGIIPSHLNGYESTLDLPAFDFTNKVVPEWFIDFVSRDSFYTANLALANGGRKARRVNPKDLLNIKIKLPPLPEQQKIAKVLTAADKEISALETQLAHLQQEKKALMQQLLTGKRRVVVAES